MTVYSLRHHQTTHLPALQFAFSSSFRWAVIKIPVDFFHLNPCVQFGTNTPSDLNYFFFTWRGLALIFFATLANPICVTIDDLKRSLLLLPSMNYDYRSVSPPDLINSFAIWRIPLRNPLSIKCFPTNCCSIHAATYIFDTILTSEETFQKGPKSIYLN